MGLPGEITQLLRASRRGDATAEARLMSLVYDDLHRLAGRYMRGERAGHTLQTTALLHETWLCMMQGCPVDWQDRAHFFALAARCMRRVLVAYARSHSAGKRGGGAVRVDLNEALLVDPNQLDTVLLVDSALSDLDAWDARQSAIVEMRFFGGLTEDEIAAVLDVSTRTVKRDWKMAAAWLSVRLRGQDGSAPTPG